MTDHPQNLFIVKTFHGLEQVLAEELQSLGAKNVDMLKRAVSFTGDQAMLYKANLCLRTALKILMPIHTFQAIDENALYKGIQEIEWNTILSHQNTFVVESVVNSTYFNHSHYVALKVKDAIVDQIRDKTDKRPSVDVKKPDFKINIHINRDQCTLSLDSSGETLNKRGYRTNAPKAPLNETLAAGLILLSDWDQKSNFYDPMCGSGTIPIEAAMIAHSIPSNINRRSFGFQKWKDYDETLWKKTKEIALSEVKNTNIIISGSDVSSQVIEAAQDNLSTIPQLYRKVMFYKKDFFQSDNANNSFVIMNPPYGERLQEEDIDAFYKSIGDHLKQNYHDTTAWILSSNITALKKVGLKPSRRFQLYNGALECKFHKFELYTGTKDVSKTKNPPLPKPKSKFKITKK